jgi:hypothetical protein
LRNVPLVTNTVMASVTFLFQSEMEHERGRK